MERYWVKLWRKSVDSQAFQNEGLWKVWSWCLMKANQAEAWFPLETGRGTTQVHLQPGQFLFGRKVATRELKMAESTVWGRMRKLEKMGNIAIKSDTHYSIITIRNWFKYQSTKNENRQPTDTNNNNKNKQNDEKYTGKVPPCPHQEIINLYHEILPDLPKVRSWTRQRKSLLKARWREDKERQSPDWWRSFFERVRRSRFLTGETQREFRSDLEWLLRPNNFSKVLEGKYDKTFKGADPAPDMPQGVVNYIRKGGKFSSPLLRERSERERNNKWLAEIVDLWRKGFNLDINERPQRTNSYPSERYWIPSAILDYAEGKKDFDEVKKRMLQHINQLEKETDGKASGKEDFALNKVRKYLKGFERHCVEMPS